MNTPIALIISAAIIGMGIYIATPRYEMLPITGSSNPAIWKLDKFSGDIALCATGAGKDANGKENESGCSKKLKQF